MDAYNGELSSKGPAAAKHEYEFAFDVKLNAVARVRVRAATLSEAKAKAGAALDQIAEIDVSELQIPGPEEVKVTEASLGHDPSEARSFEVWREDELIEEEGRAASGERRDPWRSIFW